MALSSLPVSSYKVIGIKGILVKLHAYPSELKTESGLVVPAFENYETDGGKNASRIREEIYAPIGQIEQISDAAKKEIEDYGEQLNVGDWVLLHSQIKAEFNKFIISPDSPVSNFDGKFLVHFNQILAKLTIDNGN